MFLIKGGKMTPYKSSKNVWILFLLLIIGGLSGSAATDAAGPYLPFLKSTARIGFAPVTLDLHFMSVTLGFKMGLGILTALGLIVGYWVYRKL
jgi:hypothetical protein